MRVDALSRCKFDRSEHFFTGIRSKSYLGSFILRRLLLPQKSFRGRTDDSTVSAPIKYEVMILARCKDNGSKRFCTMNMYLMLKMSRIVVFKFKNRAKKDREFCGNGNTYHFPPYIYPYHIPFCIQSFLLP